MHSAAPARGAGNAALCIDYLRKCIYNQNSAVCSWSEAMGASRLHIELALDYLHFPPFIWMIFINMVINMC